MKRERLHKLGHQRTPLPLVMGWGGGSSFLEGIPLPWTAVAIFPAGPASLKRTDCASLTLSLRDPISLENEP